MDECIHCDGVINEELGYCLDCNPPSEEERRWWRIQEGFNEIGEPL